MPRISPVDHAGAQGRTEQPLDAVLSDYFNRAFEVEDDFPLVEPHLHAVAA